MQHVITCSLLFNCWAVQTHINQVASDQWLHLLRLCGLLPAAHCDMQQPNLGLVLMDSALLAPLITPG
jgi:hypothetical protein